MNDCHVSTIKRATTLHKLSPYIPFLISWMIANSLQLNIDHPAPGNKHNPSLVQLLRQTRELIWYLVFGIFQDLAARLD
jgi:hypothetical protein